VTLAPTSAVRGAFGVQLFSDEAGHHDILNAMTAAHVSYVRVPIQWEFIEPNDLNPPEYGWIGVDEAIIPLDQAGISPVAILFTRPSWASSDGCGPVDLVPITRYQTYLRDLVERYDGDGQDDAPGSPRIGHWEVENEQDFDLAMSGDAADHGSCFGGQAVAYADHLRASYLAIKGADPTATVLFGGVAYDRLYNGPAGHSPTGPFDYHFVGDVLASLTLRYSAQSGYPFFDWMAVHIYNDFRNNWDGEQPYNQELAAKVAHLRGNQMLRSGVFDLRSRPIAITEVGLASAPADQWTHRDEDLQAVYPGQTLARAMAEGLSMVLWFTGKDRFTGSCGDIYAWQTFGLLRSQAVATAAAACAPNNPLAGYTAPVDNMPKAAHRAFKTAQAQLSGLVFDAVIPLNQTGSAQTEAYRFRDPASGLYRVVAFTDSGERLGKRGPRVGAPTPPPPTPVLRTMVFGAAVLPGWTGKIKVTDHQGQVSLRSGTTIAVTLGEAPVYVEALP
jgi:hypothetical protein